MVYSFISALDGSSNIASVIIASHIERNPRAPNLYSNAFSTIKSIASRANSNVMFSKANSFYILF